MPDAMNRKAVAYSGRRRFFPIVQGISTLIKFSEQLRKKQLRERAAAYREQLIEAGVRLLVDKLGDDLSHFCDILHEVNPYSLRKKLQDALDAKEGGDDEPPDTDAAVEALRAAYRTPSTAGGFRVVPKEEEK
jgi:hypothetical protein